MPLHLQMEVGVGGSTPELSGSEESDGARMSDGSRMSKKKRAQIAAENDTKKLKSDLSNAVAMFTSMCQKKQEAELAEKRAEGDVIFETITKLNHALNDTESLNSMTPTSRQNYVNTLKTRRKRFIQKMLELEANENE